MIEKINEEYKAMFPNETLVFGDGKENAGIVLVGEAPGKDEVKQGRPFVGKAGKNLDEFLEVLQLKREDIYITNAVKYRPTKTSERGTVSNRTPSWKEVMAQREIFIREIDAVNPKIVVTLGNTPLRSVAGNNKIVIGDCHGKLSDIDGRKIFALYHPASIIYNRSLKDTYYEDLKKLSEEFAKLR